jgi:hypothetical protein
LWVSKGKHKNNRTRAKKKKFGKRCSKGLNYQATDELLANEEEQDVTLVNEVTIENNNVSVLTRLNHFY